MYHQDKGIYTQPIPNRYQKVFAHQQTETFLNPEFYDGAKSLLFIGCTDCSILFKMVIRGLPATVTRVVATDLSPVLVHYLNLKFIYMRPMLTFKNVDLLAEDLDLTEKFDRVISIFNFATLGFWLDEFNPMLTKVKSLMNENAMGFFLLETYNYLYGQIVENLAKRNDWNQFLSNIPKSPGSFCPYFFNKRISEILKEVGLKKIECTIDETDYVYNNFKELLDDVNSNFLFPRLIPDELRNHFYAEMQLEMIKRDHIIVEEETELKVHTQYQNLVVIFKNDLTPPPPSPPIKLPDSSLSYTARTDSSEAGSRYFESWETNSEGSYSNETYSEAEAGITPCCGRKIYKEEIEYYEKQKRDEQLEKETEKLEKLKQQKFKEYAAKQLAAKQSTANQAAAKQPVAKQQAAPNQKPARNQVSAKQPKGNQSARTQPEVKQSSSKQSVANQPATKQPTKIQQAANQTKVKQPTAKQEAANEATTKQPAANQSTANLPASNLSAANEPAANLTMENQASANLPSENQPTPQQKKKNKNRKKKNKRK